MSIFYQSSRYAAASEAGNLPDEGARRTLQPGEIADRLKLSINTIKTHYSDAHETAAPILVNC